MNRKALSFAALAAAAVLLTGCSNPFDKGGSTEPVTTEPVTTTEATTDPPTTQPKNMIYFRMGEDESTEPFLTSEHITNCSFDFINNGDGTYTDLVDIFFDEEGKHIFAEKTAEAANNGSTITIWYNEYLISINSVSEPITDGVAYITGLDQAGAAQVSGWIYECIDKPETTTLYEVE